MDIRALGRAAGTCRATSTAYDRRSRGRLMATTGERLADGMRFHQAGDLGRAEEIYRQVLESVPKHADALHLMGLIAHQSGRHEEAIDYISRAIRSNPRGAAFHANLGEAQRALGELDEAMASYRRALRISPRCFQAYNNLGIALKQRGKLGKAVASFKRALKLRPSYAEAHSNLGAIYQQQGKLDQAATAYRRALQINPDFALAHSNLGAVLKEQGKLAEAAACCRRAIEIQPDHAEAHNNLGTILERQGKIDRAVASYQRALEAKPDFASAHNNLGAIFEGQGKYEQAIASYQQAAKHDPDLFKAHVNLGICLHQQGELDGAAAAYRRALQLEPDSADVCYFLGNVCATQGNVEEAIGHYRESVRINANARVRCAMGTVTPVIYQSLDEIRSYRERVLGHLDAMLEEGVRLDPARDVFPNMFYFAYQGGNDRPVHEKIARLYRAGTSPVVPARPVSRGPGCPLRVGFVSRHFSDHTVGKLTRGILAELSRRKFRVVVISAGVHNDENARRIKRHADEYLVIPRDLPVARRMVAEQALDLLVYPDIGMAPALSTLARTRLAPVQCVMWGHPVTTGIPTIDYFISSELIEPEDGAEHYSEELVRLKTMPTYYDRPSIPSPVVPRSRLGLADDRHIYLCPQSLFKFHPRFDQALAGILRGDPAGQVVLIEGRVPQWTELLVKRFRQTIPDCVARITFLPALNRAGFLNLLAVSDVVLDPFYFGGGNSSYETLAVGSPVVTLPAAQMRGRVTYGCYCKMGVLDCVASDPQHYVEIALRLGTDGDFRQAVCARIRATSDALFEDAQAVRELEQFFQHAVESRRQRCPHECKGDT